MANWYYYDKIGQKQGPIDVAQLKMLVLQGIITPETIIENRHGQTRKAGEVKGLCPTPPPIPPNVSNPNPFNSSTPSPTEPLQYSQTNHWNTSSKTVAIPPELSQLSQTNHFKLTDFSILFLKWLLDFQFKLCYFFIIEKRITRICYLLCVVLAIIGIVGVLIGAVIDFSSLWNGDDSDRTLSLFLIRRLIGSDRTFFLFLISHHIILFITIGKLIGIFLFLVFMRLIYEFYIFLLGWLVDTRQAAQHIISSSATPDSKPD